MERRRNFVTKGDYTDTSFSPNLTLPYSLSSSIYIKYNMPVSKVNTIIYTAQQRRSNELLNLCIPILWYYGNTYTIPMYSVYIGTKAHQRSTHISIGFSKPCQFFSPYSARIGIICLSDYIDLFGWVSVVEKSPFMCSSITINNQ